MHRLAVALEAWSGRILVGAVALVTSTLGPAARLRGEMVTGHGDGTTGRGLGAGGHGGDPAFGGG